MEVPEATAVVSFEGICKEVLEDTPWWFVTDMQGRILGEASHGILGKILSEIVSMLS